MLREYPEVVQAVFLHVVSIRVVDVLIVSVSSHMYEIFVLAPGVFRKRQMM